MEPTEAEANEAGFSFILMTCPLCKCIVVHRWWGSTSECVDMKLRQEHRSSPWLWKAILQATPTVLSKQHVPSEILPHFRLRKRCIFSILAQITPIVYINHLKIHDLVTAFVLIHIFLFLLHT